MKDCSKQIVRLVLSTAVVFHLGVLTVLAQESESEEDKTAQRVRDLGDVVQVALPVSALAGTLLAKDKEGSFQFLKSFGFGTASVWALKEISQKLRPDASNPKSFPSGHTFAAFSGASFINRRYGPKFGIPAFFAAGYVGFSRVYGQKHYLDDVVAGASIALFWNWRFVDRLPDNVAVEPVVFPGGYGIAVTASW